MSPRLYLASTSRWRAALLGRLGLPFLQEAPRVAEDPRPGEAPASRALRLAGEKAGAVCARHPDAWVLGSDQVAECDGHILDKPGDSARCVAQLQLCSGRAARFHTAVTLRHAASGVTTEHVDCTTVRFRRLAPAEVARYVELEQPFDCAGGFRCEGLGIVLFESIESRDPTALVGLPLIWVAAALRQAGLDPLAPA
ncbi:MAG: septum formation protein Maf [Gammaproteobacteria bacterium]|nr:MAG: septum formation protein Maf [Gammaproteobacteria bacterium]